MLAPVDGIIGNIAGDDYPLKLTLDEIGRFEQQSGIGIYEMFEMMADRSTQKLKSTQTIMLIECGLIGGGKSEQEASQIISRIQLKDIFQLNVVAVAVLIAGFGLSEDDENSEQPKTEKKNTPT